jgi:hypothetical protein
MRPSVSVADIEDDRTHLDAVGTGANRNSRSPSARTLEVLWGAVSKVGKMDVDPPHKRASTPEEELDVFERRQAAVQDGGEAVESDVSADFFLSYNFNDSGIATAITRLLEDKHYSVWMAGASIAAGEIINDSVRAAMNATRGMLLYLSGDALRSLWVAKEQLVGELHGDMTQKGF